MKTLIVHLDGIIINSYPLKYKAYKEAFAMFGFDLGRKLFSDWLHKGQSLQEFIKSHRVPCDSGLILEKKTHLYMEYIKKELKLEEDAKTFLKQCSKKYKLCLISHSHRNTVNIILETQRIGDYFHSVYTENDAQNWLPSPDIYLNILKSIDERKEETLVITGTLFGLTGAKNAGIKCLVIPDSYFEIPQTSFQNATMVVENLSLVTPELIETL